MVVLSAGVVAGDAGSPSVDDVLRQASASGFRLRPVHDGAEDGELRRYYFVSPEDVDDPEVATRSLTAIEGIETAYVKPPDEEP